MEVGEQQEDGAATGEIEVANQKHEDVTAMESDEEQDVETGDQQQVDMTGTDELEEKEDAVMESLPAEVESDKLRREREKAPDNAEERSVHEDAAGGLGFPAENTVRVSDEDESREIVVGLDGAEERNGTVHEVLVEGDAEGEDAVVETEVEMGDAPAAIEEGEGEAEEKRAGTMSIMPIFPVLQFSYLRICLLGFQSILVVLELRSLQY